MLEKIVQLPRELIMEILLRLPVKTVLLCKCVCKSWLSVISDPDFATSHFQLAATRPTRRLLFLETYSLETLSIHLDASLANDSAYASLNLDFLHTGSLPEVRGSCRGFIFLHYDTYFYILNPSTGVHKHLPRPPAIDSTDYFSWLLYGFGYDSSTNHYLVVLGSRDQASDSINLEFFSLRANKWKQVEGGFRFPHRITVERAGLLLNEAIHWLVYNYETRRDVILAFDVKEMRMSEIALPDYFVVDYTSFIEDDFLVLGGLICAWHVDVKMETVEIWVMQEYALHSSWTKTLVFSMHPAPYFSPICFTNCGDIIGIDGKGGLMKFNDKGQLLEHRSHSYGKSYFRRSQMGVYTESLLSLPGGTEQSQEDD
ncbi:hypothetical protein RYX36_030203 [Vicia faba]